MAEFRDYYELLNIKKSASEQDIRTAVRTLRKRYRLLEGSPDQEQRANAERIMALLDEAEKTLLDRSSRAGYDMSYETEKRAAQQEFESNRSCAQSAQMWLEEAEEFLKQGQYGNAYYAAKEVTEKDPGVVPGWVIRGLCSMNLDKYDEAEFSFAHALRLGGANPQLKAMLGEVYALQMRFDLAKRILVEAIELDPSDDEIKVQLADVCQRSGSLDRAISLMRQVCGANPDIQSYRDFLASCLLQSIEKAMSHQAGMMYITNERQIEYVRATLGELSRLSISDVGISEGCRKAQECLDESMKRHFIPPKAWFWVFLFLGIFLFGTGLPVGFFMLVALGAYAYFEVFPLGWKINAKALGSAAKTSGLQ